MDKRKIRDVIKLGIALILSVLYFPHILFYLFGDRKKLILSDVEKLKTRIFIKLPNLISFIYLIHNNRYYRTLFYFRVGPIVALLIGWWRPGDRYFSISNNCSIGEGVIFSHPYATIINAKRIGKNFNFVHLTTIGKNGEKYPVIGDNVTLGANVTVIGDVKIGNNVLIGAGSVVVNDIPDNSIAVGNPAKVIKKLEFID